MSSHASPGGCLGSPKSPSTTGSPRPPCSPLAVLLGGEIELEILLGVHHVEEAAPLVALADAGGQRTPPHKAPSAAGSGCSPQIWGTGDVLTSPPGCLWPQNSSWTPLSAGRRRRGRREGAVRTPPEPPNPKSQPYLLRGVHKGERHSVLLRGAAHRQPGRPQHLAELQDEDLRHGAGVTPCPPHPSLGDSHPTGGSPEAHLTGQRGEGTKGWHAARRKASQKSASSWRADGTGGLFWKCL